MSPLWLGRNTGASRRAATTVDEEEGGAPSADPPAIVELLVRGAVARGFVVVDIFVGNIDEEDDELREVSIAASLRARRVIGPPRAPLSGSQPAGTMVIMSSAIFLAAFCPFGAIAPV